MDEQKLKQNTGKELKDILSDPQYFNSYAYSRNNPIVLVDSDGQSWETFGQGLASPFVYAYHNPVQTLGIVAVGTAAVIATPVATAVVGAALGGIAIGAAVGNAINAPDADTRDYYLGQGTTAAVLTGLGIKGAGKISVTKETISDDALVVRGGGLSNQTPDKFRIEQSRAPGVVGYSVQCSNNCTNINQVGELGRYLKNSEISVVRASDVRSAGGNVIPTPGLGYHSTVTGLNGYQSSNLPWKVFKNPNPLNRY